MAGNRAGAIKGWLTRKAGRPHFPKNFGGSSMHTLKLAAPKPLKPKRKKSALAPKNYGRIDTVGNQIRDAVTGIAGTRNLLRQVQRGEYGPKDKAERGAIETRLKTLLKERQRHLADLRKQR